MVGLPVWVGAEVGRVAAVWRYPVKSMASDPVPSVEVSWHGVAGDRRWAFVRRARRAERLSLAHDPRPPGHGPLPAPVR